MAGNLANQLLTYATGAGVSFSDRVQAQAILQRAKPDAYGLRSLVHAVVRSPLFQTK